MAYNDEVIEEYKEIKGLKWAKNIDISTGPNSSILLGGKVSTAVIRQPGYNTEYAIWGIHIATNDELTFVRKADDKPILVKCLDCRKGSPTLHNYIEIETKPDTSKRLIIPREVAHLPINVNGLITINTPTLFWDFNKKYITNLELDVINVEKDRPLDKFPTYPICRFRLPSFLYPAAHDVYRDRYNPEYQAPFVFDRNGHLVALIKKNQQSASN